MSIIQSIQQRWNLLPQVYKNLVWGGIILVVAYRTIWKPLQDYLENKARLAEKKRADIEKKSAELPTEFSTAVNRFAIRLLDQLKNKTSNPCFMTPLILNPLSQLYVGCSEEVKKGFEKDIIGDKLEAKQWHKYVSDWNDILCSKIDVKIMQGLLIGSGIKLIEIVKNIYDEFYKVAYITFKTLSEAQEKANQWIEKETNSQIKNLVQDLPEGSELVLLSAALLKGKWVHSFKEANTKLNPFYNADGTKVEVPMMQMGCDLFRVGTLNDSKIKVLELPLKEDMTVYIFMDRDNDSVELPDLTENTLQSFFANPSAYIKEKESLRIALPQITLEQQWNVLKDLKDNLFVQKMKDNGRTSLTEKFATIGKVMTCTQVTFNEEGASAHGATYTPVYNTSCPPPPFNANRPFTYVFFDQKTNTMICMGHVKQLEGEK